MSDPWKRREVIGDCTLYLGDAMEILPDLQGVDSVVSDPPFGIDYKSGWATDALWRAGRSIAQDETTVARDAVALWSNGRPCLLFGSWKKPRPAGTRQVLIWNPGGALGMGALDLPWKPDHQEIHVLGNGFVGTRDSGSVLNCPPVQSMAKNGRLHPNEKPVKLMVDLVRKVPGIVVDPFMGAASTLVACLFLGRPCIGIEAEEEYFDIACRRIHTEAKRPRAEQTIMVFGN